jgi:predicted RNA-binding protein with PIN domain
MAKSTLLEPYYNFRLEVTESRLGKAMTDVERMYGKISTMQTTTDHQGIIIGYGPVITFREYGQELSAYTGGQGKLSCSFRGYYPCHNEEEVVERIGYDSESDIDNPTGSVFCANGAGFYVSYDEVYKYMHLKNDDNDDYEDVNPSENITQNQARSEEKWLGVEEIDDIINRTYNANRKSDGDTTRRLWRKTKRKQDYFDYKANKTTTAKERRENYLLVDGYNVIFAWEDLKELAKVNIDGARGKLMDILCNYQAFKQCILIVVFDAYKVKGHSTEITDYNNIHVVFTKEAETADQYIEKFAHNNGEKYNITVATSDGLEQIIIRGEGCNLISSRELKEEIDRTVKQGLEYLDIN